jgi:hypothetical protein
MTTSKILTCTITDFDLTQSTRASAAKIGGVAAFHAFFTVRASYSTSNAGLAR